MNKITLVKFLGVGLTAIVGVIIVSLIIALPFMLAWNYVMPAVFGLKTISWLQSWCLIAISTVLFKNTNSKE